MFPELTFCPTPPCDPALHLRTAFWGPSWKPCRHLKLNTSQVELAIFPCSPPPARLLLHLSLLFWRLAPDLKDFKSLAFHLLLPCLNYGSNEIQPRRLQNESVCSVNPPQGLCTCTCFHSRCSSCPLHCWLQVSDEMSPPQRGLPCSPCSFLSFPFSCLSQAVIMFFIFLLTCILFAFPFQSSSRKAETMIVLFTVTSLLPGT